MTLELETYLGKPLESITSLSINPNDESGFKMFELRTEQDFCGLKFKQLSVITTKNKMIEMIAITFALIMNKQEFDTIVSFYGSPNNSCLNDKLLTENRGENSIDGFTQKLVKRTYSTKEVGLEGKPVFMYWSKNHFNLKIMFYYEQNGMQVMFTKTD